MNSTDLAYVAGFVDGEGCISLTRRDGGKKGSYYVQVVVNNVDPRIPRWIAEQLGGKCFTYENQTQENRRQIYRWHAYANDAVAILLRVRPYLRMKRDLADRAIAFQRKRLIGGAVALPPEELAWRAAEYEWFRRRNQRGRPSIG